MSADAKKVTESILEAVERAVGPIEAPKRAALYAKIFAALFDYGVEAARAWHTAAIEKDPAH